MDTGQRFGFLPPPWLMTPVSLTAVSSRTASPHRCDRYLDVSDIPTVVVSTWPNLLRLIYAHRFSPGELLLVHFRITAITDDAAFTTVDSRRVATSRYLWRPSSKYPEHQGMLLGTGCPSQWFIDSRLTGKDWSASVVVP